MQCVPVTRSQSVYARAKLSRPFSDLSEQRGWTRERIWMLRQQQKVDRLGNMLAP